jgi:hypothetical protein
MTLREAMVYAGEMQARSPIPYGYYWSAVWWRLHAKESAFPKDPLRYARNQLALFRDMLRRPEHYAGAMRPSGMSDWLWSGLGDQ